MIEGGSGLEPGQVVHPWAYGTFTRAPGSPGLPEQGDIWVCKLGWWTEAPWDVLAYAKDHSTYPCDSTLEQLYDAAEFEAYHELGEAAVLAAAKECEPPLRCPVPLATAARRCRASSATHRERDGRGRNQAQRAEDKAARIGRVARYALAGIRIVNGSVALTAPSVIIRRFGESPASDNAAVYGLRMFGIRTVVLGVDLLALSGAPLRRALGQAIIIHASDTATAASLGLSGRVRRPWAIAITLISAANTGLAVTAYLTERSEG